MKIDFQMGSESVAGEWERDGDRFVLKFLGREVTGEVLRWDPPHFTVRHCDHVLSGAFYRGSDFVDLHLPKGNFRIRTKGRRQGKASAVAGGLSSPMPGKVAKVFVKKGDAVKKGDLLMMLEAMKMEHKILAPSDGTIKKIHFQEGERVGQDLDLLEIKASKAP